MNTRIHRVRNKGDQAKSKNEKFQFKLRLANDINVNEDDEQNKKIKQGKNNRFQNLVYKTPRGIKLPKLNMKPKSREVLQIQDNGLLVRFKKSKLNQDEKSNFFNLDTNERRKRFLNYNQKTLFRIKNRNFKRHSTERLLGSQSSKKIDYNFKDSNKKISKSTKFDETLRRRYLQRQKLNVKFNDRKRDKERKIDELVDYIQEKLMTFGEEIGDINDYIENVYNTKTEFRKQEHSYYEEEEEQKAFTEQDYLKYLARRDSEEDLEQERSYSKEKINQIIQSSRLLDAKLGSQRNIGLKRGKSLNDLRMNFENVYLTQKKSRYKNDNFKIKNGLVFNLPDNVFVTNKHLYDFYYTIPEEGEEKTLRGASEERKALKYPQSDLLDTSMLASVSDLDNSGLLDPLKHFEMLGKMDEERLIVKAILQFKELERRRAINLRIKKELIPKVEERERRVEERRQQEIEKRRKRIREEMLRKKQMEVNGDSSRLDTQKSSHADELERSKTPNLLPPKEKKKKRNSKLKVVKKKPKKKIDRKRKKPKKTSYYSYWYNCICKMMKHEDVHLSEHEDVGYYSKCGIKAKPPHPSIIEDLNFYDEKLYTHMHTIFSHTEKDMERDEKAHKCHPEKEKYEKLARRMSMTSFGLSRSIGDLNSITMPTLGIDKEDEYNKDIFASREALSVFDIEYESVYD